MKILVVYDTFYGNTEKIARAVAAAVAAPDTVNVVRASEASDRDLEGIGLLFVGSPTQGGRATKAVQAFLEQIPSGALKGVRVAVFDTRLKAVLARMFGYAAGRIEKAVAGKGANLISPSGLFIVKGSKGPLVQGEEDRAKEWARGILRGDG
jgi:flavodoxin I